MTEGHDDEKCARFQFLHRLFFRQTEQSRELRKKRVRERGKGGSKILPFERPTADAPFSSSDAGSCSSYFRSCPFPSPTRRSSPRASRPSRLLAKLKLDAFTESQICISNSCRLVIPAHAGASQPRECRRGSGEGAADGRDLEGVVAPADSGGAGDGELALLDDVKLLLFLQCIINNSWS